MIASLGLRGSAALLLAAVLAWGSTSSFLGCGSDSDPLARLPATFLWAWDRPEDLSYLPPDELGVAFLAGTVTLAGSGVERRPRLHAIRTPEHADLVAVVRVESSESDAPSLEPSQREELVEAILKWTAGPRIAAVQIDFDAKLSEREFYRSLLAALRHTLPAQTALSITALASWCLGDPWIADLPVAEAVPMLFRMGPDEQPVRRHLRDGGDFALAVCRHSVGFSTDEPAPATPSGRRVYLFHPRAWTAEDVRRATQTLESRL